MVNETAMSKRRYTFRLVIHAYDNGIIATCCKVLGVYCAALNFHLPEALWILIPLPILDGASFLTGKPVFSLSYRL